jgi:hypothetical protein
VAQGKYFCKLLVCHLDDWVAWPLFVIVYSAL